MKIKKISARKIRSNSLVHLGLTAAFLGVLIYDAWIVKNLYQALHQEPPYQAVTRIVRINTQELDKATERFNSSLNYTPSQNGLPDPF